MGDDVVIYKRGKEVEKKAKSVIMNNGVFEQTSLGYGRMEDFVLTNQKIEEVAKSMLNPLKKAHKKGIPVLNLNMKVDSVSSEYIATYIGASSSEEAALAADLMVEAMPNGGKIAIIEGGPGSDAQIYRTQTFVEQMNAHPQFELVGVKWKLESGKSETGSLGFNE